MAVCACVCAWMCVYGCACETIIAQCRQETSGSVFNITFRDNVMNGTNVGPRVKTQRGRGGVISGISFINNTGTGLGAMIRTST